MQGDPRKTTWWCLWANWEQRAIQITKWDSQWCKSGLDCKRAFIPNPACQARGVVGRWHLISECRLSIPHIQRMARSSQVVWVAGNPIEWSFDWALWWEKNCGYGESWYQEITGFLIKIGVWGWKTNPQVDEIKWYEISPISDSVGIPLAVTRRSDLASTPGQAHALGVVRSSNKQTMKNSNPKLW